MKVKFNKKFEEFVKDYSNIESFEKDFGIKVNGIIEAKKSVDALGDCFLIKDLNGIEHPFNPLDADIIED